MMDSYQTIKVEVDARGVASLCLNNPARKNAMSALMMDELTAFAALAPKTDIRVVVMSGEGGVFCAGGDLTWMQAQIDADRAGRKVEARRLAMTLRALNEMPLPLIGRIEGVAMGGGIGMVCVCDVAITAEDARFGLTETRLGLIPATISPYVIAQMGEGRARHVFMSARIFDGIEAADLGIAKRAVKAEDLDAAIEAEVAPYLNLPVKTVGRAKSLARMLGPRIDEDVIEATIDRLADTWDTKEAREGIAAFLEKRKPVWVKKDD